MHRYFTRNLTLAGHTGNVTKWQYSTATDFISPVDIASSASLTLTGAQIGNLTQTTYFRAVVRVVYVQRS
jgi:hypothetical protein